MSEMTEAIKEKNPLDGWTTLQEAAKILGRRPSVLRYWAKKGYIKTYELAPKVTVVYLDEVRAYHATHQPHQSQPTI